jgi:uncharacterized membrane protein
MNFLPPLDLAALGYFIVAWVGYAVAVEWNRPHHGGLNVRMHRYREVWMRRTLSREARMVDMQIMAALQNGTAFFASTTLLAIGGALTIMRSTGEVLAVVAALPFGIAPTPAQWEAKTIAAASAASCSRSAISDGSPARGCCSPRPPRWSW